VGEEILKQSYTLRKFRNFRITGNTDGKVIFLSKNAFQTALGMYQLDRERICHMLI